MEREEKREIKIKMIRTAPGSNEYTDGSTVIPKAYKAGSIHCVCESLARAFVDMKAAEYVNIENKSLTAAPQNKTQPEPKVKKNSSRRSRRGKKGR